LSLGGNTEIRSKVRVLEAAQPGTELTSESDLCWDWHAPFRAYPSLYVQNPKS